MQKIQVSDYVKKLPLEAKQQYVEKLNVFKCNVDPYIDSFDCNSPLPPVTYAHIYDFLISSSSVHSCESQNAFKSLDAYRMVCSKGWLSESTKLQSKCKLWTIHRAGRVTASNFKAAVSTNAGNPSISLIKKLCYPEACRFSNAATLWGCQHESDAIGEFIETFAIDHIDTRLEQCGLVVNTEYPFLGASPDGIVYCACHGRSLLEVKCPYRCCLKPISEVEKDRNFFMKRSLHNNFELDKNHSYYYQVQCQLNICEIDACFFVVWAPDEIQIQKITRDVSFFEQCLPSVDAFLVKAILPEIIGCFFTKPRSPQLSETNTVTVDTSSGSVSEVYCYCKQPDDGSKMICCENENCKSGQWFHFKCLHITKAPKGLWFCPNCKKHSSA